MFRRSPASSTAASPSPDDVGPSDDTPAVGPDGSVGMPDFSALPIAGFTRRRVAVLIGALLAAWIVIAFARQVGDAVAATNRAEAAATHNAALQAEIAGLEREMELIGRQEYIFQQARGYGLGGSREIAFTLAADAPPLPPDAPGSASVRLGVPAERLSPAESWLALLFGPTD